MSVETAELKPGQTVSERTFVLDADTVEGYVEAVGDRSIATRPAVLRDLVPPMAVAAISLRGVVEDLSIPGGTLHTGQELEFKRAVRVGETLECRATVAQHSVRGGRHFVAVRLSVEDAEHREVMTGKSILVMPE